MAKRRSTFAPTVERPTPKEQAIDYVQQTDALNESPADKVHLAELEDIISENIGAFYRVGCALREIRESKLYKLRGFRSFEDYCAERWDMSKVYAYRLESASNVIDNLKSKQLFTFLPANENQAHPLH